MSQVDGGVLVARFLKQEKVDAVFTLCGSHVQNIYAGCQDEGIRIIDVRHEQAAAHAAEGWSRVNRRPGVAIVTSGPGVTDAVTGVANAFQNRSPMVLIGGASPVNQLGKGALQEMNTLDMMKPITKWAVRVYNTERIPEIMADAWRVAMTGRYGPVYVEMPSDILHATIDDAGVQMPVGYRPGGRVAGDPALIDQAADLIRNAERPMVIGGSQVYWSEAHVDLRQFVEKLQAPVFLNAMGRGSISQEHPLFFSRTRRNALAEADVVVVVGTPMDFRLQYGRRIGDHSKLITIDTDPQEIGRNRGVDVGIEGDARMVLQQLLAELEGVRREPGGWIGSLREAENKIADARQPLLNSDSVPIHPLRFCKEVAEFVDEGTVVIGDGGDIISTAAQIMPINQPGQWFDPGPLGTLGVGTGYCLGILSSTPEKRVLMINGDGTFGLTGFEFDTFVRFGMPVVSVVGNDRQWGQITVGVARAYGRERAGPTILGDNARYDKVVEALGGHGEFVTEPGEIKPAIERAFASGLPACVNVILDPTPPGVAGGYEFL
jgi:thiamine pyrophosphate-dependent acetolactate synthase large subunit-like protein